MALIDGGKISEGAWLKVIAGLLAVNMGMGGFFGARALNTLDIVSSAVVKHEVEIINIKEEIRLIRGGKQRTELTVDSPFRFRGRGPSGPKADVPRPPTEPPQTDGPPEPKPKPQPRQERPADADTNRRDKILPVQE